MQPKDGELGLPVIPPFFQPLHQDTSSAHTDCGSSTHGSQNMILPETLCTINGQNVSVKSKKCFLCMLAAWLSGFQCSGQVVTQ